MLPGYSISSCVQLCTTAHCIVLTGVVCYFDRKPNECYIASSQSEFGIGSDYNDYVTGLCAKKLLLQRFINVLLHILCSVIKFQQQKKLSEDGLKKIQQNYVIK